MRSGLRFGRLFTGLVAPGPGPGMDSIGELCPAAAAAAAASRRNNLDFESERENERDGPNVELTRKLPRRLASQRDIPEAE